MSYGDLKTKVRAMCARLEGVSLREASDEISRPDGVASVYLNNMRKSGEVIQAGVHLKYRYFTDKEAAAAYDAKAKADLAKQMAESKERRRIKNTQRERDRRAKMKEKMIPKKRKAAAAKIEKILKPKPVGQHVLIESKQQALDKKRAHVNAEIVWPDHVKVQVVTSPDRYAIPANYEGGFMAEWNQRRA